MKNLNKQITLEFTRTSRRYSNKTVEEEKLTKILEAARLAPPIEEIIHREKW